MATFISIFKTISPFSVPLSWYKTIPFSSHITLSLNNNILNSRIYYFTIKTNNSIFLIWSVVNCHTDISKRLTTFLLYSYTNPKQIPYQLWDTYSIWRCCWNVAINDMSNCNNLNVSFLSGPCRLFLGVYQNIMQT